MSKSDWQRARSSEQIETRIQDILRAAETLFKTKPYEKITMQMIARESRLSQSNLARYFKSKEEIFLAIYREDLLAWQDDALRSLVPGMSPDEFAVTWTDIYCRQKRMLELSPLLALSLERNSSEEAYRKTKMTVKRVMEAGVVKITASVPSLNPEQASGALLFFGAYAAGLYPMTIHSPLQERVLEELNFHALTFGFRETLETAFQFYLKGMLAES